MTPARRLVLALAGITAAGALTASALLLGSGPDAVKGAPTRVSAPQAEEAPPAQAPSEKPTVKPYATRLSGRTITPTPGTTMLASVPAPQYADGCDHNYGQVPLCVPWAFPEGSHTSVKAKCAWLRDHDFPEIPVTGTDRQGLDPDHDGIACEEDR